MTRTDPVRLPATRRTFPTYCALISRRRLSFAHATDALALLSRLASDKRENHIRLSVRIDRNAPHVATTLYAIALDLAALYPRLSLDSDNSSALARQLFLRLSRRITLPTAPVPTKVARSLESLDELFSI